jgi:hypothetical protein
MNIKDLFELANLNPFGYLPMDYDFQPFREELPEPPATEKPPKPRKTNKPRKTEQE